MEYKIRKSSYRCSQCEREMDVGESYCSVLLLEEQEPVRTDYCESCFSEREVDADDDDQAYWRTRRAEGTEKRRAIDFVTLRELFFRMAEHQGEEYRQICYLVALVLIRKRLLKLSEFVTVDGVDYLVVTTRLRKEPLRLEAPELHPAQFAELREKLTQLLDIDFAEGDLGEGEMAPLDLASSAPASTAEDGAAGEPEPAEVTE